MSKVSWNGILIMAFLLVLLLPAMAEESPEEGEERAEEIRITHGKLQDKNHTHSEEMELFMQEFRSEPWRIRGGFLLMRRKALILLCINLALVVLIIFSSRMRRRRLARERGGGH